MLYRVVFTHRSIAVTAKLWFEDLTEIELDWLYVSALNIANNHH